MPPITSSSMQPAVACALRALAPVQLLHLPRAYVTAQPAHALGMCLASGQVLLVGAAGALALISLVRVCGAPPHVEVAVDPRAVLLLPGAPSTPMLSTPDGTHSLLFLCSADVRVCLATRLAGAHLLGRHTACLREGSAPGVRCRGAQCARTCCSARGPAAGASQHRSQRPSCSRHTRHLRHSHPGVQTRLYTSHHQ
jgi:hypothetical protein